jgi:hypothetical protein
MEFIGFVQEFIVGHHTILHKEAKAFPFFFKLFPVVPEYLFQFIRYFFSDMAAMQGASGMGAFYANMPDEVTLTVNGNHPVYKNILASDAKDKQEKLVHNLADLALLSQGLLKGNSLTNFINRSVEMMS